MSNKTFTLLGNAPTSSAIVQALEAEGYVVGTLSSLREIEQAARRNPSAVFVLDAAAVREAEFRPDVTAQKSDPTAVEAEQALLRQLIDLHERERQLIAYEIHDGFAQQLTGALLNLQAYHQMAARNPPAAQASFQQALEILTASITEARHLISGLRPPILDESGIVVALEYLVYERRAGDETQIELVHDVGFDRLAPPLETAIFRIVQESIANARRHSRSEKVRVELFDREVCVVVEVRDWGVGFEPAKVDPRHFGLESIRQRARLLGGQATITSAPGQGTVIRVELPLILAAKAESRE